MTACHFRASQCYTLCSRAVCTAEFPSAPNLTAAAAAQSLEWAPVTLQSLSISSVGISQDDSTATALLNLTLSAELGVSGSIADVAVAGSTSHRRSLLATDGSELLSVCAGSSCMQLCVLTCGSTHICRVVMTAVFIFDKEV